MARLQIQVRTRVAQLSVTLIVIAALPIGLAAAAAAAPPPPTPAATTIVESGDFASERRQDPWDFSNSEDWNTAAATGGGVAGGSGLSAVTMTGGVADFNAVAGATLDLTVPTGGEIPLGYGASGPIDASRYNRVSFHMYSSASAAGAVWFFNCPDPGCWGAKSFVTSPGWNTYDLALTNDLGGIPWAGSIQRFRLMPNSNVAAHITLDSVRLYSATTAGINVTIPQAATQVWWDTDTNQANNGSASGGGNLSAGLLLNGFIAGGGNVNFATDRFQPKTYYIYYLSGGVNSDYSAPITINARPIPVVIDPDISGGDDYATVVRGDAWDFAQASDVAATANTSVVVAGGQAHGSASGTNPNDAKLFLPIAAPINASLYHRLTYTVSYSGTWGLEDAPGGGMTARFLWRSQGHVLWNESNDMVVYPGTQTNSVDLKTNPPQAINDENTVGAYGWGGPSSGLIDEASFDPHEDPGSRSWSLDNVKVARDDRGTPNFDIKFKDNAWEPGTTASIYADTNNSGLNGTLIASSVPVTSGVNTYTWTGGVPPATYWVYVVLQDPAGVTGSNYSTGPVEMPANAPGAPGPVSAVAGVESANVSWSAPASNGGSPVTGYVLTISPGGGQINFPAATTSTTVTGLSGATPYTFNVAARNAVGTGPGTTSNSVVPTALPGTRFHSVVPFRSLDSRGTTGGWSSTKLGQGESRDLTIAGVGPVPPSATAVVANVTVTNGTAGSFVTTYPSGAARPNASNLNFAPGQTVPNLVTTKIGASGRISVYNALGATDVVVDVVGYYDNGTGVGDEFRGMTPARVLDSRGATGGWASTPLGENASRNLVVAGVHGIPSTAGSVVLNVTVTKGTKASFLTVYPAGASLPISSNLNFAPGQTVPNLVTVGVGAASRVTFYNKLGDVDVVADVVGYYDPTPGGGKFHSITPTRVLDSRNGTGGFNTKWGPGQTNARDVAVGGANGIPLAATGAVTNVTVDGATMNSFLTIYPSGVVNPETSNNLFGPGPPIPNLAVTQLAANGKVTIVNQMGFVHVIADVAGYFL